MNSIKYEKIRGLHLELSTKCNALCAMCNRNYKGKKRDNLQLTELTLDDIKKIMSPDFIKQLDLISMCGVFRDPITNTFLFEILDYIYLCNDKIIIHIYTNGSLHNELWWKKSLKNHQ